MTAKLRIGVIGAGFMAAAGHIPGLLATEEVELTAVCRRTPEALATVADLFDVPHRYTDHERMLAEAPLDAVVVSSPHALHHAHVRAALERGLPVLTDKPLAVRLAEAEELRALAASRGLPLLVAVGPPYDPVQRYLRERIAAGDLGTLHLVQSTGLQNVGALFGQRGLPRTFPFPVPVWPTDFRRDPALGGGGYFQDVGSHAVAGILAATGLRPVEVTAAFDDPELDVRPVAVVRFSTGAVATISQVADAFPDAEEYRTTGLWLYVGSEGRIFDTRSGQVLWQRWGQPAEEIAADALPPPSSPARNFVGVLRGREEPLVPVDTAVETVRVVEAAYRSAREGRAVRLESA
jgi:predicted dehydrogenase